jgi:hypothetical protein
VLINGKEFKPCNSGVEWLEMACVSLDETGTGLLVLVSGFEARHIGHPAQPLHMCVRSSMSRFPITSNHAANFIMGCNDLSRSKPLEAIRTAGQKAPLAVQGKVRRASRAPTYEEIDGGLHRFMFNASLCWRQADGAMRGECTRHN